MSIRRATPGDLEDPAVLFHWNTFSGQNAVRVQ